MQTYKLYLMLLACALLGCSKSDQGPDSEKKTESGAEAEYTVILTKNDKWSGTQFNANLEKISLNQDGGPFTTTIVPELSYREGIALSLFKKKTECEGEIIFYDFDAGKKESAEVFGDLGVCKLFPKGLAHSSSHLFMAYGLWNEVSLKNDYFVRIIDRRTKETKDIPLNKEPLQLVFSNNRLFVLGLDAKVNGIYSLIVVDTEERKQVHEINLGADARTIAKNSDGNILVSFNGMHIIIDSAILKSISEVRYNAGKEPKFGFLAEGVFNDGKLYYRRSEENTGDIPQIPAVYDFSRNMITLYYYENWLTAEQLQFEYNIGDTSMVSYDPKNNLILIGYRKKGNDQLGGILRIKPAPEPKFIDNTDLEGVPYAVFVN